LFTKSREYSVLKLSKILKKPNYDHFIRINGIDYQVVIFGIGTDDGCIKKSSDLEKTLKTDVEEESDHNSSLSSDSQNDQDRNDNDEYDDVDDDIYSHNR
jgi:hypothetical protein